MAAKQQVKRRGKIVKKNKLQKKHLKARQRQKLQARKFKKHHSRFGRKAKRIPRAKAASDGQPKICSPRLFASKILRQMPKVRMEAKARGLMKTLLTDLYSHVANEVETLGQKNDLSSISCDDVKNFLNSAMEKELAKHTTESTSTIPTTSNTTATSTTTTTNSA